MGTKSPVLFGYVPCIAGALISCLLAGCDGNGSAPIHPPWDTPPSKGTGTLTISVADPEGRPLVDATVIVFGGPPGSEHATTGATGVVTIGSLPENVTVGAVHEFGLSGVKAVQVAQQGVTFLALTVQPGWPQPTVALLPVSIPFGSVSADRSALSVRVAVVSSTVAPFVPANPGTDPTDSPFLGLTLADVSATVSMQQRAYDLPTTPPPPAARAAPGSAMLLLDQSQRVASLDPSARRSFADREFIRRAVGSVEPYAVSVVGFAGTNGTTSPLLPTQPIWSPLGSDTPFSTDGVLLRAAVGDLEPLVGGSAPVFEGLRAALGATAVQAPPGNRTVVAMLGGGDDGEMSEPSRQSALAALRRQRDESGIQVILIAGARLDQTADRNALAELAAALRAPAISLGMSRNGSPSDQTWASGSYAALSLAADLVDGLALPTLSAEFRIATSEPNAFPAGAMLHGTVLIESEPCPFDCQYLPLEFAVEIP
jgi:hypothetical protein